MRFVDNLFGVIAQNAGLNLVQSGIDFIPIDGNYGTLDIKGNYGTLDIKGKNATWIGLGNRDQQLAAYQYCSPLASVIDRLAEADINGKPEILRAGGKGKEDYATSEYARKLNALFTQPNPLQSWLQFRGQQVVYKKIFGFCPVWPINPAGFPAPEDAYQLWNLPPWLFDYEATKKIFRQKDIGGIVKTWVLNINGERVEIPADKIFILEDSFLQDENCDFILPKSRMVGLDMAVSNICAAMEADNVLLKKKGPLGAWTHDPAQDRIAGYVPMSEDKKQQVQADLSQYGLSFNQYQYIISRHAIKWQPTSFDVNQLGTSDTLVKGTKEICHRYNYSYTLLEESESTFSANGVRAHVSLYQNNVIPQRSKDDDKYTGFFRMRENNCKLVSNFEALPILQPDKKAEADTIMSQTNAYVKQYKENIITMNMMLEKLGYDTRADGDVFYNQTEEYKRQSQVQSITQ